MSLQPNPEPLSIQDPESAAQLIQNAYRGYAIRKQRNPEFTARRREEFQTRTREKRGMMGKQVRIVAHEPARTGMRVRGLAR